MIFNGKELTFDRKSHCDFCGEFKRVAITKYGTTHYNRLICEKCAREIKRSDAPQGLNHGDTKWEYLMNYREASDDDREFKKLVRSYNLSCVPEGGLYAVSGTTEDMLVFFKEVLDLDMSEEDLEEASQRAMPAIHKIEDGKDCDCSDSEFEDDYDTAQMIINNLEAALARFEDDLELLPVSDIDRVKPVVKGLNRNLELLKKILNY